MLKEPTQDSNYLAKKYAVCTPAKIGKNGNILEQVHSEPKMNIYIHAMPACCKPLDA